MNSERSKAEEDLRVIRSLMERATVYRAISSPAALVAGFLSIFAAGAIYRRPVHDQGTRQVIAHLRVIRIDQQSLLVLVNCLRSSAFSEQGETQTIVCFRRLDSQLFLKQIHCLCRSVRLVQDVNKMTVRQPTSRITSNSRPIKRLGIAIHPALPPGEEE